MLKKCPECNLQVSDKAITCPHCGYPIIPTAKRLYYSNRRRRLPNGFGRITKISNQNLRNPYRAMITIGKTEDGKPISRILKPKGYFKTYNDAYAALIEYNKNPYDFSNDITVSELYNIWSEKYYKEVPSVEDATKSAWNYCSSIKDLRVTELRARHIKYCIEEGVYKDRHAPASIKIRIKVLFNLMLDYAVEYEIVERNYARTFSKEYQTEPHKHHMTFTEEEVGILWDNLSIPYVDVLLIQCYSGMRPQELGLIEIKNVDLNARFMTGGLKTEAGKNRIIPIHSKIYPLVRMRYNNAKIIGSDFLINCESNHTHKNSFQMSYGKYRKRFYKIVEQLGLDPGHKPHDGRKTFVTMAKKAEVDEYAIKYIVGHRIYDITEDVYTERSSEWLLSEIEKIT